MAGEHVCKKHKNKYRSKLLKEGKKSRNRRSPKKGINNGFKYVIADMY